MAIRVGNINRVVIKSMDQIIDNICEDRLVRGLVGSRRGRYRRSGGGRIVVDCVIAATTL